MTLAPLLLAAFAASVPTPTPAFFAAHRGALARELPPGSVAVFRAAPDATVEGRADTYRQDSDFWYLTGLEEPDSIALLWPDAPEGHRFVLFVRPKVFAEEQWTGFRTGLDGAKAAFGADEAHPVSDFWDLLKARLPSAGSLHVLDGGDEAFRQRLLQAWAAAGADSAVERPVSDAAPLLHEMRLVKDETEIALLRRAAALSAEAHKAALREVRPGAYEYALKAALVDTCLRGGAARMGYPPIVASGPNSVILHYERDDRRMNAGEMIVNDSACEYGMYSADVTRSYPVSGKFSPEQRAIYEIVLAAQKAGFQAVRPGVPFRDVFEATVRTVVDGLLKVGILTGDRETILRNREFKDFYPHGSGHWLGLNVHDAGSYSFLDPAASRSERYFSARTLLKAGMALTVEPGIYIPEGAATDRKWWNLGVRIEDDVLVTPTGMECLSCAVPREIPDLERALGR